MICICCCVSLSSARIIRAGLGFQVLHSYNLSLCLRVSVSFHPPYSYSNDTAAQSPFIIYSSSTPSAYKTIVQVRGALATPRHVAVHVIRTVRSYYMLRYIAGQPAAFFTPSCGMLYSTDLEQSWRRPRGLGFRSRLNAFLRYIARHGPRVEAATVGSDIFPSLAPLYLSFLLPLLLRDLGVVLCYCVCACSCAGSTKRNQPGLFSSRCPRCFYVFSAAFLIGRVWQFGRCDSDPDRFGVRAPGCGVAAVSRTSGSYWPDANWRKDQEKKSAGSSAPERSTHHFKWQRPAV